MENRIQHILLSLKVALALSAVVAVEALAADDGAPAKINNEVFDLGLVAGVVNIADFNGEMIGGISATFRASEDFFLQYNYLEADASASAFETSQGMLFDGDERTFRHYDLLVGYNLFQGELFPREGADAHLSALYLVAGVGDTQFGGEDSFTYTLGTGYQVALTRRIIMRIDYRGYIYTSNLITDEDRTVNSNQLSAGLSFLF